MTELFKNSVDSYVKHLQENVFASIGRIAPELVLKNGRFVNVFTNQLESGDIAIHNGYIVGIGDYSSVEFDTETGHLTKYIDCTGKILCPGFIDGHIHIESSMLSPGEFAASVVPHGTTAVITDPHEITNVAGKMGIEYMLESSEGLPLDVYFMLPSCVPATSLDESGAVLEAEDLEEFFENPRVLGLAELMNSYGTLLGDEGIFRKIAITKKYNKIVDGHAPGLQGKGLNGYIAAGVVSDHECSTVEDAKEKLSRGQWIMIREGTAAKNMDALMPLFQPPYCYRCMLVTDDKHPGDIIEYGHVDYLIRKAVSNGADPILAVKMATIQPAEYFGIKNTGAIAPGYKADIAVVGSLYDMNVLEVYKDGKLAAQNKIILNESVTTKKDLNKFKKVYTSFHMKELKPEDFIVKETGESMRVIELVNGEILTNEKIMPFSGTGVNPEQDIVKLAVAERHLNTGHIGVGFLKGYGLKNGAIASSIAHDSHNLIIVGTNDLDMSIAGNCVRKNQGGLAIVSEGKILGELPLPIAGVMCDEKAEVVEDKLGAMKKEAKGLGVSEGIDPFMTLAFISLSVIPDIRLTTRGLVKVDVQEFVPTIF